MADTHAARLPYGSVSDEVAEDYRKALEDLTMNSRYEISNLTVIAKENTEHALAISEALKNHIKQTSPAKKLPAFYVLDSVVKNVGTPYTLFFGRQLYSTFMEAYALVDNNVRRKMDEMLKTWKEPVPGSIDTRPVFPPEVTRPIENALIKARTSAVQAHQEHMRSQQQILGRRPNPSPTPFRDTPTPPGAMRQAPPGAQGYPPSYGQQQYPPQVGGQQYPHPANGQQPYGLPQRPPSQQYPNAPGGAPSWQQPQAQGYPAPDNSIDSLTSDITNLIAASKAEFAQNPWDGSIQTRLKALLDLQTILSSQKLPQDQIALIKDQVAQLSEASKPPSRIQTPPAPVLPSAPVGRGPSAPPAEQPTLQSLLGPGALAALLASQSQSQSVTPQPTNQYPQAVRSPQPPHAQPSFNHPAPPAPPSSSANPDPNSLLEKLRAAGMLPQLPTAASTPPLPLNAGIIPGFIPTPPSATRTPLSDIPNDVTLKPASLKIPRPHLISSLYERLGAPCTQCGRRFQADEEGRKKKTAHMDWHFKVHQRMTEAEKRGQHRSWYVDEMDWIKSREVEDDQNAGATDGTGTTGAAAAVNKPQVQYLPVPDDPPNTFCPICQEKFEMKWLDDAQEFVWMDAKRIGDRIYHASCFSEATKDGGSSAVKRGTPEPVLGKRKAEDDHIALRTKIKTEAAT